LANAKAGRLYEIRQTGRQLIQLENEVKQPFFADLSAQLGHEHKPSERNDFAIQPALPFRLGRSGPALATADIDGDGDRDLIITDTSDARLTFLLNDGNGVFAESPNSLPVGGTGVVVFDDGQAQRLLHLSEPPTLYSMANGQLRLAKRLAFDGMPSCAAALDVDGDGDTDLFIGGSSSLGQFPVASPSQLFLNDDGNYTASRLADVGLVSGCATGDMDGDGDTDLVLACEWAA
jgi:hypothetical protein